MARMESPNEQIEVGEPSVSLAVAALWMPCHSYRCFPDVQVSGRSKADLPNRFVSGEKDQGFLVSQFSLRNERRSNAS